MSRPAGVVSLDMVETGTGDCVGPSAALMAVKGLLEQQALMTWNVPRRAQAALV
jgi:hypothetical protein